MRCLSRSCPLRSAAEKALLKAETPNKNVEIDEDDREAASFEMAQDAPAAPEDALPEIPTINAEEDQERDYLIDLWPFARPIRALICC